jgi:hypothetical protein
MSRRAGDRIGAPLPFSPIAFATAVEENAALRMPTPRS